jgi:hypothetical protein
MVARDGVEPPTPAFSDQLIPLVLQQLNFAEWPQFCDHSVSKRRCSPKRRPQFQPCCGQHPRGSHQSQARTGGNQNATPAYFRLARHSPPTNTTGARAPVSQRRRKCVRSHILRMGTGDHVQPHHCYFGVLALESLITGDPLVSPAR